MLTYVNALDKIKKSPRTWLITGVAGFIGSNLLEHLLLHNQKVIGLDNFMIGYEKNLHLVQEIVGQKAWNNFTFINGDIRNLATCQHACKGVQHVLHHAAIGSVAHSMTDPILINDCNVTGFLNMLVAGRDAKVQSFVYAASSAAYGDSSPVPRVEENIGVALSPYAVTKYINELYADVFQKCYDFNTIGLRYFNIFGCRQDPHGAYAAVIPKWFSDIFNHNNAYINGDGETTRDFCYVENVVQINILAALASGEACNKVYNVGSGESINLKQLFKLIQDEVIKHKANITLRQPIYSDFRTGDVRHSLADITRAKKLLGYAPQYNVQQGLSITAKWYAKNASGE